MALATLPYCRVRVTGGRRPAIRRPARVALLGIAPTSQTQRAFHDSQQWAVRADVA